MPDFSNFRWRRTNAPDATARTDDVWFLDENVGWAVNSDGKILKTDDGGDSWVEQALFPDTYLRCVAFADATVGWAGTLTPENRLLHTTDGGVTWRTVDNLPGGSPLMICGLCVVDGATVYAAGSNVPTSPTAVIKTKDGGDTWSAVNMKPHAALLVDIYFKDRNEGWVVGGEDVVKHPGRPVDKQDVIPTVLHTTDGGATWSNLVAGPPSLRREFPRGEWGWKIQALDDSTMFVSLQNYRDGAILRSDDGGRTWRRLRINDRQRNSNLEGIGFLDRGRGWVGGYGDVHRDKGYASATVDGGEIWDNANQVGFNLNRFRFVGSPVRVAYASGRTVYKFTDQPEPETADALPPRKPYDALAGERSVDIPVDVPDAAGRLLVNIWEPDGRHITTLADERSPAAGARTIAWDFNDASGAPCPAGAYIVRVTLDARSQSYLAYRVH